MRCRNFGEAMNVLVAIVIITLLLVVATVGAYLGWIDLNYKTLLVWLTIWVVVLIVLALSALSDLIPSR